MYNQNYFGNTTNELIVLSFRTFLPSKTIPTIWGLIENLWWILWCIERCIDSFLIIFFINFIVTYFSSSFVVTFSSKPLLSTDTLQSIQETGNSDFQFKFKGNSELGSSENLLRANIDTTTSFDSFAFIPIPSFTSFLPSSFVVTGIIHSVWQWYLCDKYRETLIFIHLF